MKDLVHVPLERPGMGRRGGWWWKEAEVQAGRGWWNPGATRRLRAVGPRARTEGVRGWGVSRVAGTLRVPGRVLCPKQDQGPQTAPWHFPPLAAGFPGNASGACALPAHLGPSPEPGLHPWLKASGCLSLWPPCSAQTYRTACVSVPTHFQVWEDTSKAGSLCPHPPRNALLRLVLCPSRVNRITTSN